MVLVIVWTPASWLHRKNAEHVHPLYYGRFIWPTLIYPLENVRIGPAFGTRAINLRVNVFEYEQSDWFETEQLQAAAGKRDALRFLLEFRSPNVCQLTVVHISSPQTLCIFLFFYELEKCHRQISHEKLSARCWW